MRKGERMEREAVKVEIVGESRGLHIDHGKALFISEKRGVLEGFKVEVDPPCNIQVYYVKEGEDVSGLDWVWKVHFLASGTSPLEHKLIPPLPLIRPRLLIVKSGPIDDGTHEVKGEMKWQLIFS